MLSRLIDFYHFNPLMQRLKNGLKTHKATAWFVPYIRDLIYAIRNRAHSKIVEDGSLQQRFVTIYKYNLWADNESVSGEGSNFAYTSKIRESLPQLLKRYAITSIVDAPCGDFNWMRYVLADSDVRYTGIDIVEDLIQKNRMAYASNAVNFIVGNICEDQLPDCDLLITRDCLFHLSFEDIDRYLKNIAQVNFRFLLTTSHTTGPDFKNSDIKSGDFRQINLLSPPFSLPKSAILDQLDDAPDGHPLPRVMMLIAKTDVPTSLYR